MSDSQQIAELGRRIQAHLGAGQSGEARDLLIRYCELNASDVSAWRTLAQLHDQLDQPVRAAGCLQHALAIDPGNAGLHMQLVAILKRVGDLPQAAQHCRLALQINREPVDWWWELGDLSAQMEEFPVVEQCCRAVLERNPSVVAARLYLGIALQRQGSLSEAGEVLRAAIACAPAIPDAWFYLGLVSQSLGDPEAALQHFRRALDLGMAPVQPLYNMALIHQLQGRLNDALQCSFQALQGEPGSLKYRQLFVRMLRAALPERISQEMLDELLRCFDCPGIDGIQLMKPGMVLLMQDAQLQQLVWLAARDDYDNIGMQLAAGRFDDLLNNSLLHSLLMYTRITSVEFESVLKILRRIALVQVLRPGNATASAMFDEDAAFAVALAGQFFNTGYAAFFDAWEAEQVALLIDELCSAQGAVITDNDILQFKVTVLCMYQPLYSMCNVEHLVEERLLHVNGSFSHLFRTQWLEYLAEKDCLQQLACLGSVKDVTSRAVQAQYEESPYPRWETVTLCQPLPANELFATLCPGLIPPEIGDDRPDVLIAGCGTGRHAIMSASLYGYATVLAVDLSASSLGYAMRKAQELGIKNLRFAQADILELGDVGRKFHIIESVGVLHHLRNPEDGLRVLTGLLQVNGLIRLGLYSKVGRRDVVAARDLIAARCLEATPDGIRCARTEIMALPSDRLERQVTRYRDFYSMSGCRDLLFHVQEWRFDVTEVAGLLQHCGLQFRGFDIDDAVVKTAYLQRNPHDPEMLDLNAWQRFEAEFPDTFSEMYQFWCQKI
jgi:tetratricopeptide (TPR) repeat protein/2-polyprenyl-3-methyl-5-hydroxy-6-metoxy-1,4-benzoquinol methylase